MYFSQWGGREGWSVSVRVHVTPSPPLYVKFAERSYVHYAVITLVNPLVARGNSVECV